MKKLLLLLTLISRFAFGQGSISTEYNSTTKKSYLKTGVFPKANVITYTDTSVNKSPVWWFNTGRIKFKNSIVAIDTADFDGILVSKGDSLLLADKNLMVIGVTNGLTLSSGFAKIGGTLTDSTVIDMNNRSLVFKTNSADVNKEVIKITDESDNIALIVNQSGKNVIALGKNAGSGTISAEDCNFLGENAGSGATNALFSNFMGKNAGLNSTTATHSNFFGQGAGSSAPLAGSSNFLGANAGAGATNAGNSNFLGQSAGNNAVNANGSNFLGYESGNGASNANGSNFLGNFSGSNSTNANNSNFFGFVSGRNATNAYFSNFIGPGSGDAAINANNSNFFGAYTGLNSTNASNSNFFGKYAGRNAINAANSIFIGTETGDSSVNLANSIVIGKYSGRKETLNTTTGGTSIQIGNYTHTGGFNNTIAIGDSATNTKTNQVVFAPKYRHLRLRGVDYELPASQGATDTYLKNDGSGVLSWATVSGGSGTVTSVTSANTDISVANTTTTPVLTLNSGSGANQIVKRDGSGNLNATTVTTNANLTGVITSIGNATSITSQTGTGSTFAMSATPTFTTNITTPLIVGGTGTTSQLILRSTSGAGTTGSDIIFQNQTNGSNEPMRILSSGNVGIGTATPDAPLVVSNSSSAEFVGIARFLAPNNAVSGNVSGITIGPTNTANNAGGIRFYYNGSGSTSNRLDFGFSGNVIPAFSVLADGNLGIGTSNPQSRLSVTSGLAVGSTYASTNAAPTDGAIIQGVVGIGTATPNTNYALDVGVLTGKGSIRSFHAGTPGSGSGGNIALQTLTATAANQRIGVVVAASTDGTNTLPAASARIQFFSSQAHTLGSAIGAYINFETAANGTTSMIERMRIENYGTVGINTTTPNSNTKLHVGGLVQYGVYTVSTLPTCNAGTANTYATVTDALTPTYLTPVVGGGAIAAPVFCNSSQWVTH